MADLSGLGDLVIQVGGDISPLQTALDQIPQAAQRSATALDNFFAGAAPEADKVVQATESVAKSFTSLGTSVQQATQPVQGFATASQDVYAQLGNLGAATQDAYTQMARFAQPLDDVYAKLGRLGAGLEEVEPGIFKTSEGVGQLTQQTQSLSEQLAQLGGALAISAALKSLGEAAIEAYSATQKATIALGALTGSADLAAQQINELRGFALSHDLEFPALVQANQRMTALGIASAQIPQLLLAAANAAAAMNSDFTNAANVIDRMATSGAVMARSLAQIGLSTQDLAKAMNITAVAGENLGTAVTTAFKALDQTERVQVLTDALNKFAGVAEQVDKTLSGQLQDLKTQFQFAMEGIGKAIEPVVMALMEFASTEVVPAIKAMIDAFNALPEPIRDSAVALGLATAAIAPLTVALKGLALAFPGVIAAAGGLAELVPLIVGVGLAVASIKVSGVLGEFQNLVTEAVGLFRNMAAESIKAIDAIIQEIEDKFPIIKIFIDAAQWVNNFADSLQKAADKKAGIKQLGDSMAVTGANARQFGEDLKVAILGPLAPILMLKQGLQDLQAAMIAITGQSSVMAQFTTDAFGKLTLSGGALKDALDKIQAADTKLNESMGQTGQAFTSLHTPINQTLADYHTLEQNLVTAQANLAAVKAEIANGVPLWGQLAAAQKEVEKAQVALNPAFITSAEAQKILAAATKELNADDAALAAAYKTLTIPAITSVIEAQNNLEAARQAETVATEKVATAESNIQALLAQSPKNYAAINAAVDASKIAREGEKAAIEATQAAHQALIASQKDEKAVLDALAAADRVYADGLRSLHVPALLSYDAALKQVQQAEDAESAALQEQRNAYEGLKTIRAQAVIDTTAEKAALDALKQADLDVVAAKQALVQAQKDQAASYQAIKAANAEQLQDEKALDTLYRDNLIPHTKDLKTALDDLRATRDVVLSAAKDLEAAELALDLTQLDSTNNAKALKEATDAARMSREQFKASTDALKASEQALQQDFGVTGEAIRKIVADTLNAAVAANDTEAAFKELGIKSAQSLQELANKAANAYQLILNSGVASANQLREARIAALQAEQAAQVAAGGNITAAQQAELDKLILQEEQYQRNSKSMWLDWERSIVQDFQQLGQQISHVLVQSFFGNSQNDQLDKQAADLKSQLADQAAAWAQAQQDASAQLKQITADNAAQLQQQLADLKANLDDKTAAYNDYVANYKQQLADLQVASAQKTAQDVQALRDSLAQKESDYAQYKSDTLQKIQDLTQAEQDGLAQTIGNLQDALAQQTEAYDQFVQDINTKLSRIGSDLAQNIGDETTKVNRNIADKNTALQRDQQDAATQIQRLRENETAANKTQTEQQIADIQTKLQREQQDTQTYIQRAIQDLQTYTDEHKKAAEQQTQDLQTQLARQTEDYNKYLADNKQKQEDATAKAKEQLDKQVQDLRNSLEARQAQLHQDEIDAQKKIEEVTAANAAELAKQEAGLKLSLDKQTAAYEKAKADIEKQMADATLKAHEELLKQEAAVQKSLDTQKSAYDKFVTDTEAKLKELHDQHVTIWNQIGDLIYGPNGILGKIAEGFFSTFLVRIAGNIGTFIATSIGNLLGKLGLGGIVDKLGDIFKASTDTFSGMSTGINAAKQAMDNLGAATQALGSDLETVTKDLGDFSGGAGGSSGGGVGGGLSGALGGISGIVGIVSAILQLGSEIFQGVQAQRTNNLLGEIEKSTRGTLAQLVSGIQPSLNQYLPVITQIYGFETSIQLGTLQEIRDLMKAMVTITVTVAGGGTINDLGAAIGQWLAATNTAETDALLRINSDTNTLVTTIGPGFDKVLAQMASDTQIVAGQIHDLNTNSNSLLKIWEKGLLGGIGGGLGSIGSALGGGGNLISSIIGLFSGSKQDKALGLIEENTRFAQLYLGGRADQGILGQLFTLVDVAKFGSATKGIEKISADVERVAKPFWGYGLTDLDDIKGQLHYAVADLDQIKQGGGGQANAKAGYEVTDLDQIKTNTGYMLGDLNLLKETVIPLLQAIHNDAYYGTLKLDAILTLLSGGVKTSGTAETAPASLTSYIGQQFGTLEQWLGAALKPLLTPVGGQGLAVPPVQPGAPTQGTSTPAPSTAAPVTTQTTVTAPSVDLGIFRQIEQDASAGNATLEKIQAAVLAFKSNIYTDVSTAADKLSTSAMALDDAAVSLEAAAKAIPPLVITTEPPGPPAPATPVHEATGRQSTRMEVVTPEPVKVEALAPLPVAVKALTPAPVEVKVTEPAPVKVQALPPEPVAVAVKAIQPDPVHVSVITPPPVQVAAVAPLPVKIQAEGAAAPEAPKTPTPAPIGIGAGPRPLSSEDLAAFRASIPAPVSLAAPQLISHYVNNSQEFHTSNQTATLTVQIMGPVYGGPSGINELTQTIADRTIDTLRRNGLKF